MPFMWSHFEVANRKMVAICSDSLLMAISDVFGCSTAHLEGYYSDFFQNSHLQCFPKFRSRSQFFQIVWPTSESIEDANLWRNCCNTPWDVRFCSRKHQTWPSTVRFLHKFASSILPEVQKLVIQFLQIVTYFWTSRSIEDANLRRNSCNTPWGMRYSRCTHIWGIKDT